MRCYGDDRNHSALRAIIPEDPVGTRCFLRDQYPDKSDFRGSGLPNPSNWEVGDIHWNDSGGNVGQGLNAGRRGSTKAWRLRSYKVMKPGRLAGRAGTDGYFWRIL